MGYNLLFRFDHSTFSKNRARLMQHDVAKLLFGQVVAQAQQVRLLSSEHFSVGGTHIDAWASLKSFKPKDAEAERKVRNQKKADRRLGDHKYPPPISCRCVCFWLTHQNRMSQRPAYSS